MDHLKRSVQVILLPLVKTIYLLELIQPLQGLRVCQAQPHTVHHPHTGEGQGPVSPAWNCHTNAVAPQGACSFSRKILQLHLGELGKGTGQALSVCVPKPWSQVP